MSVSPKRADYYTTTFRSVNTRFGGCEGVDPVRTAARTRPTILARLLLVWKRFLDLFFAGLNGQPCGHPVDGSPLMMAGKARAVRHDTSRGAPRLTGEFVFNGYELFHRCFLGSGLTR